MNRQEQILYLNKVLLEEMPEYKEFAEKFAQDVESQRRLLRSLMNLRLPMPLRASFLTIQDELLTEEVKHKGIIKLDELPTVSNDSLAKSEQLILWQGDITRLAVDAIVNAANSAMLGCFAPCHGCIDNAIHSAAGLQLRNACADIMIKQGHEEPTGQAKITPAFNLPCKYVIHTVGPIVQSEPTPEDIDMLKSCYISCLNLAQQYNLKSVAFCCISTGEFHFSNKLAAEIAIKSVTDWIVQNNSNIKVIFNVFKDIDLQIYRELLSKSEKFLRR